MLFDSRNSSRPAKEDPIAKFFAARQMVNRSVENYFSAAGANGNAAQRPPGVAVPYPASSSSSYGLPANAAGSLTNSKTSFTLRPGPQQVPNYGFDDAGVGIIVPANEVQKGTLDRKGSKKRSSIITTSSSNSKISPIDTPVIMANPNLEKLLSKKDFDTTNNNSISSSSSSSTTIKKVTFARNELSSPVSFTAANFSSREYVEHQSQNYHQYKNDRDFFLMNQKSPKITTTHHNATNIDGEVLLKKQQHSNDTEIFNAESKRSKK
uniref:Uncharacterized protein n=1 Tax=Romanomermis culicivorax TaxID=13658 RepID=A0A915KP48_ROMCU